MTATSGYRAQRRPVRVNGELGQAWLGPVLWVSAGQPKHAAPRRKRRPGRWLTLLVVSLLVLPAWAGIAVAGDGGGLAPAAEEGAEGVAHDQEADGGSLPEAASGADEGSADEDTATGDSGSAGTSAPSTPGEQGGGEQTTGGEDQGGGGGEDQGGGGGEDQGGGGGTTGGGGGTTGGGGATSDTSAGADGGISSSSTEGEPATALLAGEGSDEQAAGEEGGEAVADDLDGQDGEVTATLGQGGEGNLQADTEDGCDPAGDVGGHEDCDPAGDLAGDALDEVPGSGVATLVSTGNAIASGNLSDDRVVQVIDVVVSGGATVHVEQLVLVVNVGTAYAQSGGNAVSGFDAETWNDVVTLLSGGAVAIGNVTYTDVNQYLAALGKDDMHIHAAQTGVVVSAGYAQADSGGNVAIAQAGSAGAGSLAATTGAAYALGNLAEVFVTQDALAMASGSAVVMTEQSAVVVNQGVAVANSGGNLVAAGGSAGAGHVTTGPAVAEGNVSTTDIKQKAVAVATGEVTVEIRQGTIVLNIGVALANSGANSIGTGAAGSLEGPDGGFEHAILSIEIGSLDDLEAFGDHLAYWLSQLLGDPLALGSFHHEEHLTEWYDEESGSRVTLVQRALVFNLGFAQVVVGDNVTVLPNTGAGGESDVLGAMREGALGSLAEVVTGNASAVGNLSVSIICQRMAIGMELDAPECFPQIDVEPEPTTEEPVAPTGPAEPEPEPEPAPAPTHEATTVEVGGVLLVSEQWGTTWWTTWWTTGEYPASTLPRTGLDTQGLGLGAGLLLLLGVSVLLATPRRSRRRGRRCGA